MPTIAAPVPYAAIDAVPLDFELNVRALEASATAFLQRLGAMPRDILRQRTAAVYGTTGSVTEPHRLAYHQALHMVLHSGQIRTIRNLYRTTRGLPPRFFPENPTFPAKRPNL